MNDFIYNQITDILEENNIHLKDFIKYTAGRTGEKVIDDIENALNILYIIEDKTDYKIKEISKAINILQQIK